MGVWTRKATWQQDDHRVIYSDTITIVPQISFNPLCLQQGNALGPNNKSQPEGQIPEVNQDKAPDEGRDPLHPPSGCPALNQQSVT
jgi:hypothetical protein